MIRPLLDKLNIWFQILLPARLIGRFIYRLSRCERPWIKDRFIRWFCWFYSVNTNEVEKPVPSGYRSFNEFFTRKLLPDVRPLDERANSLLCPADGTLAQFGYVREGSLLQAKGMSFRLQTLLGDGPRAEELANCGYATIYLAPYNYHRLHMPTHGTLECTRFIPGKLFSVNAITAANVPGLYALNERLVCHFRSPLGPFAMVLVGAMNVASISTAWGGEIMPDKDGGIITSEYSAGDAPELARGDYMGHFNMGSTIVLVGPTETLTWPANLNISDTVRVGGRLGAFAEPNG